MADRHERPEGAPDVYDIVKAVRDFDLTKSKAWKAIEPLSDHTRVDSVDAHPAGVVIEPDGKRFSGLMTVYVGLEYGAEGGDGLVTSDRFPGEFKGHIAENGSPVIESMTVDTKGFFA